MPNTIVESAGAPAALGIGTAEATVFSGLRVPSKARGLLAWQPIIHTTAPAAAESVFVVVGIRGADFHNQPQEVFAPVGGSHLGTIGGNNLRDPRWHRVNAALNGNETFDIYAEALDAMAGNARIGVNLLYSVERPVNPPLYSQCTRETAVGTAAGAVTGGSLTISQARKIVQLEGVATNSTVTADEPLSVNIALNSSAMTPQDQTFDVVADTVEATSGIQTAYPCIIPVDIDVHGSTIVIASTYTLRLALTAAGQAGHCVKWIR
jgi:hypothetical protein